MTNRKAHWNRIYSDTLPQTLSWYQSNPTLSLKLIRHAGLNVDEPIIDIGGGASLLVDELLTAGYSRVAVLDVAASALARTRQRLGGRAAAVEWFAADVTTFIAPHLFSLWHDRAVFHFLTDAIDRRRYLKTLKRTLTPNGQLVMATFAIGGPTRCSGLDIVQYDADKLTAELGADFTLAEQAMETHQTPIGKTQRFAYFRFVRG